MLVRTWPYGTTKRARVLKVEHARWKGTIVKVIALEELDGNEAHILVERPEQTPDLRVGDVVTLTFSPGGPMGGHFRIQEPTA